LQFFKLSLRISAALAKPRAARQEIDQSSSDFALLGFGHQIELAMTPHEYENDFQLAKDLKRLLDGCRDDPNRFMQFVFNSLTGNETHQAKFHQSTLHRELQNFLSQHHRALVELPRDHGKTTQLCGRILWELGRQPDLRIKIVCATSHIAKERVRFLRECIEKNPRLKLVFPNLQPSEPWQEEFFTIMRTTNRVGHSVMAIGFLSGSTGTRADLLVCDDIVDAKAISSESVRERVHIEFENNLLNLLEPEGRFWGLFTPWHPDDLNATLKKKPSYALFRRAINSTMEPIWPEKWPTDKLTERRLEIGEAAFARGYFLEPIVEGELLIPEHAISYWFYSPTLKFERLIVTIDPAVSKSHRADYTACVVLGLWNGVVYCLEARARRVNNFELATWIGEITQRWPVDMILFETNGQFAALYNQLQQDPFFGPYLQQFQVSKNKEDRIRAFAARVQMGQFKIQGSSENAPHTTHPSQADLFQQMTLYPTVSHDDLIDATASGTEFLFKRSGAKAIAL
jgi:phage terminase large subunit-like protein